MSSLRLTIPILCLFLCALLCKLFRFPRREAPWPLAMLARCVARSLTYSWVYGTINPLKDSLITEVIKHLNVQTRWAPDDVYAFATRRGRQPGWRASMAGARVGGE